MTDTQIVLSADDITAARLVGTIRASVNGEGKYAQYVEAHNVNADTVKDHAFALAVLSYPNDAPVQKKNNQRTRFGNAVQMAAAGLRRALPETETDAKPAVLRVSLSGEGGATVTVPSDHEMYAALVEMVTGQTVEA